VLITTHAAPKIALARALVGDRNLSVRTGTCSLDKFVLPDDKVGEPGDWEMVENGSTHYLSGGEEMHWSFGKFFVWLSFVQD
jgi:transcription factor C subunit 7